MENRKDTIRYELLRTVFRIIGSTLIMLVIIFLLLIFTIKVGVVLPANYQQSLIEQVREELENNYVIEDNIFPAGVTFHVFSNEGTALYGSFKDQDMVIVEQIIKSKSDKVVGNSMYKTYFRDSEMCIVKYSMVPRFNVDILNTVIPNLNVFLCILIIVFFVLIIWINIIKLARNLNNKLLVLQDVTKQIEEQNLDFSVNYTGMKEFDEVISALDKMKNALEKSLKENWEEEKRKQQQMASLVHDVKIPITIIRGNAELLTMTELDDEQKVYTDYILEASGQIEKYIGVLMEVTKLNSYTSLNIDNEKIHSLIESLVSCTEALINSKDIKIEYKNNIDYSIFFAFDKELICRALLNVIMNAIDFLPNKGEILVTFNFDGKGLEFIVEDNGPGFETENIGNITELLYKKDSSRKMDGHYGIGLTFAKRVCENHNGKIILGKSKVLGGAKVSFIIPQYLD